MAFVLPDISRANFAKPSSRQLSPEPLDERAVDALYAHYQELALWNRRTVPDRAGHPGRDPRPPLRRVARRAPPAAGGRPDAGSTSARAPVFPGLVLAAARPGLEMTLVEARERKWAFLSAAARKAALPCRCLNARVQVPLPAGLPESIDVITSRALRLDPETWSALANRLDADGRVLLWAGEHDPELPPELVSCGSLRSRGARGGASWRCAAPLPGP